MAISKDVLKNMSAEDALNVSIADLPEVGFKPWANGDYKIQFGTPEQDQIGDKPVVKVPYTMLEIVEIADEETGVTPADGAESNITYFLPSGAANIGADFKAIAEANGFSTPLDILQGIAGMQVVITLSTQFKKTDGVVDKSVVYQRVKAINPLM